MRVAQRKVVIRGGRWPDAGGGFGNPGTALKIEKIPIPEPKAGEVLVRVTACGVCHTGLHVIKSEVAFPTPAVLGHEISGTVEASGPGVESGVEGPAVGTLVGTRW